MKSISLTLRVPGQLITYFTFGSWSPEWALSAWSHARSLRLNRPNDWYHITVWGNEHTIYRIEYFVEVLGQLIVEQTKVQM